MNSFDSLLERNKEFAAQQAAAGTLMPWLPRALPGVKAIIIGCADMRVDPAHVLGIRPGEAVVMRNIGGRITPGLLQQLGLLGRIGEVAGEIPGGGGEFHFIVLQHTDCGITRLAKESAMLPQYFRSIMLIGRTVMSDRVKACCSTPATICYWFISSLTAWGILTLVAIYWHPLHASSAATCLFAMAIGCSANWLRNRTFHCAITGPLFLIGGITFLLSGVRLIHLNTHWAWPIILIGVGVAFLLESLYAQTKTVQPLLPIAGQLW
jgi:hypothetical protein